MDPSPDFIKDELDRCLDLVNKYQPDIFWFNAGLEDVAYDEFRRTFAAHYLNVACECSREVVFNTKAAGFPMNIAVLDIEAGGAEEIREQYWQTDMSITFAEWHYSPQFGYSPLTFLYINVKLWNDRSTVSLLGCKIPVAWQVEDGKLTLPDLAPFQRPSRLPMCFE